MKPFVLTAIALSAIPAVADTVTLSFYKDNCEKFLQSEASDQEMYLMWATTRINKGLPDGATLESTEVAKQLRKYCTAHPLTPFVEVVNGLKVEAIPSH